MSEQTLKNKFTSFAEVKAILRTFSSTGGNKRVDGILIFLPLFRLCFDKLIVMRFDLKHEIVEDRNIGASLMEATVLVGFATVFIFVLF